MKFPQFNEPELYLLKHWEDLLQVERSMRAIRDKYPLILDNVLDRVSQKHRALAYHAVPKEKWESAVGIAKQSWPRNNPSWPSGLWLGFIGLHHFSMEQQNPPDARVLSHEPKGVNFDLNAASERLYGAVQNVVAAEPRANVRGTGKVRIMSDLQKQEEI